MAIRTFLALDLDASIRRAIVAAADQLPVGESKVSWVAPQNLHVTMKFLGDVPDADVMGVCRAVEDAAAELAPVTFDVAGLECIPSRGPVKMVWAGVCESGRTLTNTFAGLESAMEALGFDVERRAFRPHVTVGRFRYCSDPGGIRQAAARLGDEQFGTQSAGEVVVYSSQLTKQGPVYAAMARCKLGR